MSLIQIPLPGPAQDTASSMRWRGRSTAASHEANMWGQVAALGGKIKSKGAQMEADAEEWRNRQDRFALSMASSDISRHREVGRLQQMSRQDLGAFDNEGVIGYDRAMRDYETQLTAALNKSSRQIPAEYRDVWLKEQDDENAVAKARFGVEMIDRRTKDTTDKLRSTIGRLAGGEVMEDTLDAAGNPIRIPMRPEAAMELLAQNIHVVPAAQQQAMIDYTLEQVVYGLLNNEPAMMEDGGTLTGPQQAMDFLAKSKSQFQPKDWDRLMSMTAAQGAAMQSLADRERTRKVAENDRTITARVLQTLRGTADNPVLPDEIGQAMLNGQISAETGRMMWDRLTKTQEDAKTQEQQDRQRGERLLAYGRVRAASLAHKRGDVSYEQMTNVWRQEFMNLSEEDAEMFLEEFTEEPITQVQSYSDEALKIAGTVFKPLVENVLADDPTIGERLKGRFSSRLDAWTREHYKEGVAVDRNAFMTTAIELMEQVRREYEEEKKAGKKPRTLFGHPLGMGGQDLSKPPQGFDDYWPDITDDRRKAILNSPVEIRHEILRRLKAIQAGPGPLPVDMNAIPSSELMR